jgi:hypothetical protein
MATVSTYLNFPRNTEAAFMQIGLRYGILSPHRTFQGHAPATGSAAAARC